MDESFVVRNHVTEISYIVDHLFWLLSQWFQVTESKWWTALQFSIYVLNSKGFGRGIYKIDLAPDKSTSCQSYEKRNLFKSQTLFGICMKNGILFSLLIHQ